MLQKLFTDRFRLQAHQEMKEGSLYELVVAPGGSKSGLVTDSDTAWGLNFTINGRPVPHSPTGPVTRGVGQFPREHVARPSRRGEQDRP